MSDNVMNGGFEQVSGFFTRANDYRARFYDTEPNADSRAALVELGVYWNEHRDKIAQNLRLAAVLSTVGINNMTWGSLTRVAQVSKLSDLYVNGEASLSAASAAAQSFLYGEIDLDEAVAQAIATRQGRPSGNTVAAYEQVLIDWVNAVKTGQSITLNEDNFPRELIDRVRQINIRVSMSNNKDNAEKKGRGRPKKAKAEKVTA